jgi:hypothetical protein
MNLDSGRLVALNVNVLDASYLAVPVFIEEFLRVLIARIHMRPLTTPMSIVVPPDPENVGDRHADDGGMTTQVIISTSHIAYHSWPLQDRFRLVVDSCRDFSAETVLDTVDEWFAVKSSSIQDVPYLAPGGFDVEAAEIEASEAVPTEATTEASP